MTSPIDTLKKEIQTLTDQREALYEQFEIIESQLQHKNTLIKAFILVSTDPDLYAKWKIQVDVTPIPVVENAEKDLIV